MNSPCFKNMCLVCIKCVALAFKGHCTGSSNEFSFVYRYHDEICIVLFFPRMTSGGVQSFRQTTLGLGV